MVAFVADVGGVRQHPLELPGQSSFLGRHGLVERQALVPSLDLVPVMGEGAIDRVTE